MMAERVVAKGGSGYLVFSLGRDNYAIEVEKVKEVIKAVRLTPLPRVRDIVAGVLLHRGVIIPILDLSKLFGVEDKVETGFNWYIVVKYYREFVGLGVAEIVRVAPASDYRRKEGKKGPFAVRGVIAPPYPEAIVLDWDGVLNLAPEGLVS